MAENSANESPSGATSRSWKQYHGTPSFVKNSNAAAIFARAAAIGSADASSHGRSRVPIPNMSRPSQANECQKQTPIRRWSSIRLPSTSRSGW